MEIELTQRDLDYLWDILDLATFAVETVKTNTLANLELQEERVAAATAILEHIQLTFEDSQEYD